MSITQSVLVRQHLIDPEICIRCNTCEEMCPIDAITHDSNNYVVKFEVCNWCNACLGPCPTGAIDNARHVLQTKPFTLEEQLVWESLPEEISNDTQQSINPLPSTETQHISAPPIKIDTATQTQAEDIRHIRTEETLEPNRSTLAPYSAAHPYINQYTPKAPITATVSGNYRLTAEESSSDIHHIVLDFGASFFPVLEGQSIGIIPPGTDAQDKPHLLRMYSVASPRDSERPGYNNVALTVKRVTNDYLGKPVHGVCSNYICDLKKGDKVQVTGPYGSTFLMPNHPGSSLLMICTGTGSAPMRAMTERRRRIKLNKGETLMLFFGARTPNELPYFGPLQKLPQDFININFAFSRVADQPKQYVQDLMRHKADQIISMLNDENCYIYICGLKAMEAGVLEAFHDICRAHGMDWKELHPRLLKHARFHVETY